MRVSKSVGLSRGDYIVWLLIALVVTFILNDVMDAQVARIGFIALFVVALAMAFQRLRNIGWSGWLALLLFVPGVNVIVGGACLALPSDYGTTRKLDTLAKTIIAAIALLVAIVLLGLLMESSDEVSADDEVRLYPLFGDIQMPFSNEPNFLGIVDQLEVNQYLYQTIDDQHSIGFSAAVMRDVMPTSDSPQEVLKAYLTGTLAVMGAEVESENALQVGGRPARIVVAYLTQQGVRARSHTIAIFDDGKVHSWAIQDIPQLSGDHAPRVFERNFSRIVLP